MQWKQIRCWLDVQRCKLLNERVGAWLVMPMLRCYNEVNQVKARDWGRKLYNCTALRTDICIILVTVITFVATWCQDWSNKTALSFTKGRRGCITKIFTKSGSVWEPGREKKGFFWFLCLWVADGCCSAASEPTGRPPGSSQDHPASSTTPLTNPFIPTTLTYQEGCKVAFLEHVHPNGLQHI